MQQGNLDKLAEALQALGHPTKLRVFKHIMTLRTDVDPAVPTMVSIELGLPIARAAASMKRLSEVGVLDRKVSGRYTFYRVNTLFLSELKELFE